MDESLHRMLKIMLGEFMRVKCNIIALYNQICNNYQDCIEGSLGV